MHDIVTLTSYTSPTLTPALDFSLTSPYIE